MTRAVDQLSLEQVTAVDTNLRQRLSTRDNDLRARLLRRRKAVFGLARDGLFSTDTETDTLASGSVVGGLEVYFASGFGVVVTKGAMLCAHPGGASHLTRPGTWSGRIDEDDDALGLYELALDTTVAPSPVPSPNVATPEWWAVVVTPSLAAVELDSARVVFNAGTGVFDAASQNKVFHRKLTASVVRGSGGGDISTVSIPAGGVVVAWIYVHLAASTSLAEALFFDARRMPDPGAQNRVGGRWSVRGQSLRGELRATLAGEDLGFRSGYATTNGDASFQAIAEPGATFPPGLGTPIAYLYLCKVRGTVPRFRGTGLDSNNLSTYSSFEHEGALVLSPTAPVVLPVTPGKQRFDLRNGATLTLPNPTVPGGGVFPKVSSIKFGGTVPAGDAICVGVILYSDLSSGIPTMVSGSTDHTLACDEEGWCGGDFSANILLSDTNDGATVGSGSTNGLAFVEFEIAEVSAGKKLPVEGVEVKVEISTTDAALLDVHVGQRPGPDLRNLRPIDGRYYRLWTNNGGTTGKAHISARAEVLPTERTGRLEWTVFKTSGSNLTTGAVNASGYKLPYGKALYTPALSCARSGRGYRASRKAGRA